MSTKTFYPIRSQHVYPFLKKTGVLLSLIILIASCDDDRSRVRKTPTEYAQTVCDCTNNSSGNLIEITKCFQNARVLRDKNLHTEAAKKQFNDAAIECVGTGVVEHVISILK